MDPPCRWAIMGTAGIAKKNTRAILLANNATLVAIASRKLETAEKFRDEIAPFYSSSTSDSSLIQLYGSYNEMLQDPSIDAVYMPLPTALHLEWAVKAADAGKSILLEKPVALSCDDLATILVACRRNNVVFMDGVMFMHGIRLKTLRRALQDPHFGSIERVSSSFSFHGGDSFLKSDIRASPR
jgi:predicted dehydrogenase